MKYPKEIKTKGCNIPKIQKTGSHIKVVVDLDSPRMRSGRMARAQLGNGQADTRGPTTMETRTGNRLGLGSMRRGRGATMGGRGLSHISRYRRCGGEAERECQNAFRYRIRWSAFQGASGPCARWSTRLQFAGLQEWRSVRDYLVS